VITDFGVEKPAIAGITDPNCNPKTNPENPSTKGKAKATSKPANEVITDLNPFQRDEVGALPSEHATSPQRSPRASACTAYREAIELGLSRGRNAVAIWHRPVEDWGKLLGDAAAVSAMLDRLLHHGHVLKCGPRSWRTKADLPPQEAAG
jgi:hypothetical protein